MPGVSRSIREWPVTDLATEPGTPALFHPLAEVFDRPPEPVGEADFRLPPQLLPQLGGVDGTSELLALLRRSMNFFAF